MPSFHLILQSDARRPPRRIDFEAESVDHAFQVARNRTGEIAVELWEGRRCHVRMTRSAAPLWELHRHGEGEVGARPPSCSQA